MYLIDDNFKKQLSTVLGSENIFYNQSLKEHSYFKIGGKADVLLTPTSFQQLAEAYLLFKQYDLPVIFIGNGSNILFSDLGVRGGVIKIGKKLSKIHVEGNNIIAEAGALMKDVSAAALNHELSNYEFASGIPGTIGGAVFMNAGAYGGEMADVVTAVTVLSPDGTIKRLEKNELDFRYRGSRIQDKDEIALEVELELTHGNKREIKALINELREKRVAKQPLNLPSAGSTFKRPEGYYAGKLIEDAGLRGLRYKDAAVSEKHCGFIVNLGDARANDVLNLINIVQKTVYDMFEVRLEPEVRMVGEGF